MSSFQQWSEEEFMSQALVFRIDAVADEKRILWTWVVSSSLMIIGVMLHVWISGPTHAELMVFVGVYSSIMTGLVFPCFIALIAYEWKRALHQRRIKAKGPVLVHCVDLLDKALNDPTYVESQGADNREAADFLSGAYRRVLHNEPGMTVEYQNEEAALAFVDGWIRETREQKHFG